MRLRGIENITYVNGPGKRTTIWTQGCTVGCKNCINPETWDPKGGFEMENRMILNQIFKNEKDYDIDGVSFSGGEPFEKGQEFFDLIAEIKRTMNLDILVYTGRLITDIKNYDILNYIDILVDGPFIENQKNFNLLWRGSSNQNVYLLNERIRTRMKNYYKLLDENGNLLDRETGAEVSIGEDGEIQLTGFSSFSERHLKKLV